VVLDKMIDIFFSFWLLSAALVLAMMPSGRSYLCRHCLCASFTLKQLIQPCMLSLL
jgi:hypothetical protein